MEEVKLCPSLKTAIHLFTKDIKINQMLKERVVALCLNFYTFEKVYYCLLITQNETK